ncbi:hypothetical protein [Flavobacterium undicola]|uniref:hypothetical protein n=1 Tax=Flavobacterium undicola TaxID=1932779 RepID=UPI0013769DCD|nr:hypothetical protein [Flavobacterium undicola]MBA0885399.1 hypothetical protein [Flavobacterium undicola]
METNNLGSKDRTEAQNNPEESIDKNISNDTASTDLKLNKEVDIDADGNKTVVERARSGNENTENLSSEIDSDNPNANRGVTTDKEAMKTVENKDRNSDITPNRYPNSHPDNQEDRGNMKLDE